MGAGGKLIGQALQSLPCVDPDAEAIGTTASAPAAVLGGCL